MLFSYRFSKYIIKIVYNEANKLLIFSDSDIKLNFWKNFDLSSLEINK